MGFFALLIARSGCQTTAKAQTFSVLYNFGTNPGDPIDGTVPTPNLLAQGRDGQSIQHLILWRDKRQREPFYQVTPAGKLTVLYSFDGAHGSQPWSAD